MKKIGHGVYVRLGRRLKEKRDEKGYSLRQAAALVGCSNPTILRIENAEHKTDDEKLRKYCEVLGLDVDKMIHEAEMDALFETAGNDIIEKYRSFVPSGSEKDLLIKIRELPLKDRQKVYALVDSLHKEIDEDSNGEIRREKEKQ